MHKTLVNKARPLHIKGNEPYFIEKMILSIYLKMAFLIRPFLFLNEKK